MTMNFGGSRVPPASMGDATVAALTATFQQLDGAYARLGAPRTQDQLWKQIGATPMIGQNDVPGDVFTPGDARSLMDFAAPCGSAASPSGLRTATAPVAPPSTTSAPPTPAAASIGGRSSRRHLHRRRREAKSRLARL